MSYQPGDDGPQPAELSDRGGPWTYRAAKVRIRDLEAENDWLRGVEADLRAQLAEAQAEAELWANR